MSKLQRVLAITLAVVLLALAYGLWATRPSAAPRVPKGIPHLALTGDAASPVDQSLLTTAQRLAPLAATAQEQPLAAAALRLADHELEVAFTAALRELEAHPPALSPEAQRIDQRLQRSQKQLQGDQDTVTRLTAALASARVDQRNVLQDQLDLAQAQLDLDRDEVAEANEDLLDAGGNQHQRIETLMQEHAASTQARTPAAPSDPLASLHGLAQRLREWRTLRSKTSQLASAAAQASAGAQQLAVQRAGLAAQLDARKESIPELASHSKRARSGAPPAAAVAAVPAQAPAPAPADAASLLGVLRQVAADQRVLALLDQRVGDRNRLARVYQSWTQLAAQQASTVLHEALQSALFLAVVLLLLVCIDGWLDRLLARAHLDRRQLETLRSLARVSLQIIAVIFLLVMLIGVPAQLGTMLGIVGAGLTVALRDFIVAFIGWFVLMGRNGIRLGDWVEINGVSGEVIELNAFHTVLLETGNWTDAGHPTGRRVTFTNSYAIQGHYFNFSTSGQWLWDELTVLVPYERDANLIADTIYKQVLERTAESAHEAQQEWRRTAPGRRGATLTVSPGISIRPGVGGVEVTVRYVTRASERLPLRAQLYQSAVQLLSHGSPRPVPA
jgi:small-conductance mechanosensitive channel